MVVRIGLLAALLGLTCSCVHSQPKCPVSTVTAVTAPYEQFVARNFDWNTVRRVVIMPIANQSPYPRTGHEIQTNLAAELQRVGRFEIVRAEGPGHDGLAETVFGSGHFDELQMLQIARDYQADAILFVNVTQYHPYARPRLGLSMLMVSPAEGIAIATITGLWDSREASTSAQAQAYFQQTQFFPRSLLGTERVFDSPDAFQRFVCQQVAVSFGPTGQVGGTMMPTAMPTMLPASMIETMDNGEMVPARPLEDNELPPVPPPAETP